MDVHMCRADREAQSFSFVYAYSEATGPVIDMWQRVHDEVVQGGGDQSQFAYWAKNMTAAVPTKSQPRSFVSRPAGEAQVADLRLKRISVRSGAF